MENGKKILIVEDDQDIRELLHFNLEKEGFTVFSVKNGQESFELLREHVVDLVVLDLMLPDIDGLDILKNIKLDNRLKDIAVIILSAKGEEIDRILGLELGADDYVIKPFSIRELKLRVKGLLKRTKISSLEETKWRYKGIVIDRQRMEIYIDGEEVDLTVTEWKLLMELIDAKGQVLSRDFLLTKVWGYDFEGYARTVDTHIRRLRKKLGQYANIIKTIRGVGYKLKL